MYAKHTKNITVDQSDLDKILSRKGYAIQSQFKRRGTIISQVGHTGEVSDLERGAGHESLPKEGATLSYSGKCKIVFRCYRRRLTDPLGDCEKYFIDSLRYAGLIRDDTYSEISIEKEATIKVESLAEERVEIDLYYDKVFI